jgi:hypothetical protein
MTFGPVSIRPPYLVSTDPMGDARVSATPDGRFSSTAHFDFVNLDGREAFVGSGLEVPGGCRTLKVLYVLTITWSAEALVVPGPGYASGAIMLDTFVLRTQSPTGNFMGHAGNEISLQTETITHMFTPVAGVSDHRQSQLRMPQHRWQLSAPTVDREACQFAIGIRTEAGGGGFWASATARASGLVRGIFVSGE